MEENWNQFKLQCSTQVIPSKILHRNRPHFCIRIVESESSSHFCRRTRTARQNAAHFRIPDSTLVPMQKPRDQNQERYFHNPDKARRWHKGSDLSEVLHLLHTWSSFPQLLCSTSRTFSLGSITRPHTVRYYRSSALHASS